MSYADALRLLGAGDPAALRFLNRLGGVAAAGTMIATATAVDLFSLRDELISWGNAAVTAVRDKISGVSRFDRTQRLLAAHTVIVITAFFEALQEEAPFDTKLLALTKKEQAALATNLPIADSFQEFVSGLITSAVPIPAPNRPYEQTLADLHDYYGTLADRVIAFAAGLAKFERRRATDLRTDAEGRRSLADSALRRYEIGYRTLAADVPEFAIWASMTDGQATRAKIAENASAFQDSLADLASMVSTRRAVPDDHVRRALSRLYRNRLDRPVMDASNVAAGVVLPTLGIGYLRPRCQTALMDGWPVRPTESWWLKQEEHRDAVTVTMSHLSRPSAARNPLTVLGQPGGGKSVFTQVLAALLLDYGFFTIRIELRDVPAATSIQDQIEEAIRKQTGERISWPELMRDPAVTQPVILFDGLDEILLTDPENHENYLQLVREFQNREYELGRPVAAIITARTAVTGRIRFPAGTALMRLLPFDDDQVRSWLAVWNAANAQEFARRNVLPLSPEAALVYRDLAAQPLLLLMLALYDATGNALQSHALALGRAELYERLFTDFAKREINKGRVQVSPEGQELAIDTELQNLEVAAIAMFNRSRLIISGTELEADMALLLGSRPAPGIDAQATVGRFFFVYESISTAEDGHVESAYEFLHTTFQEFLVARLLVNTLVGLTRERRETGSRNMPDLDGGFLFAILSFSVLAQDAAIVEFCSGLFARLPGEVRSACATLLEKILMNSLDRHSSWTLDKYEPISLPVTTRYAAFSANLAVAAVLAADAPVDMKKITRRLFTAAPETYGLLWKGQLSPNAWESILSTLRITYTWHFELQDNGEDYILEETCQLGLEDGSDVSLIRSLPWFLGSEAIGYKTSEEEPSPAASVFGDLLVTADSRTGRMFREAAFINDDGWIRYAVHSLVPYWSYGAGPAYATHDEGMRAPSVRALLELRLAPASEVDQRRRKKLYQLLFELPSPEPRDRQAEALRTHRRKWLRVVFDQLREDAAILGADISIGLLQFALEHSAVDVEGFLDVIDVIAGSSKGDIRIPKLLEELKERHLLGSEAIEDGSAIENDLTPALMARISSATKMTST